MQRRKFLLFATGSTVALMTGAMAFPGGPGGPGGHGGPGGGPGDHHHHDDWEGHDPWHWLDDHGHWHGDHDRYWRSGYGHRRYVDRDFVFGGLRRRGYRRFEGDPYWYRGRYVVRTYDRWGNLIFVEVDPYTGDFLGVVRF